MAGSISVGGKVIATHTGPKGAGTVDLNVNKLKLTPSSAPSSPVQGDIYLDSSDGQLKIYNGTFWKNITSGSGIVGTGGTVTDITDGGINYRVHTFTSSGTFQVLGGSGEVEYLVVAGGGGGGSTDGGGGGAGGYRSSVSGENSGGGNIAESKLSVSAQSYIVTVGAGGAGTFYNPTTYAVNGNPSSIDSLVESANGFLELYNQHKVYENFKSETIVLVFCYIFMFILTFA